MSFKRFFISGDKFFNTSKQFSLRRITISNFLLNCDVSFCLRKSHRAIRSKLVLLRAIFRINSSSILFSFLLSSLGILRCFSKLRFRFSSIDRFNWTSLIFFFFIIFFARCFNTLTLRYNCSLFISCSNTTVSHGRKCFGFGDLFILLLFIFLLSLKFSFRLFIGFGNCIGNYTGSFIKTGICTSYFIFNFINSITKMGMVGFECTGSYSLSSLSNSFNSITTTVHHSISHSSIWIILHIIDTISIQCTFTNTLYCFLSIQTNSLFSRHISLSCIERINTLFKPFSTRRHTLTISSELCKTSL